MQIKTILENAEKLKLLVEIFPDLKYDFVYSAPNEVLITPAARQYANTFSLVEINGKFWIKVTYVEPNSGEEIYFPDNYLYVGKVIEDECIFDDEEIENKIDDINTKLGLFKIPDTARDDCIIFLKEKIKTIPSIIKGYIKSFAFANYSMDQYNEVTINYDDISFEFLTGLQNLLPNHKIGLSPGVNSITISWKKKS